MTEELKKRIAQINAGTAPAGYKKTKVGIVPEEWEVVRLGEIADDFSYGMNAAAKGFDGENKYIRITDIDETTHHYLQTDSVSPDAELDERYLVNEGDILFARTGASTGKTYLYNPNDGKLFFAGFLIRVQIIKAIPFFVFLNTLTEKYQQWLQIMSVRSGQPGINANEYATLQIPSPPFPEQHKIAEILTAQDAVIALMQKQIELLQKQKKAFLQKMFPQKGCNVPEIRFAGFTDAWVQRKLSQIVADISTGKSVNSEDCAWNSESIGVLKTSCVSDDLFDATECKKVIPEECDLVKCPVEADTIIVSRMNTPDRVGACGYVSQDYPNIYLPDRLWKLRMNETTDTYLIYLLLTSDSYKARLKGIASGTSGSMHNIPKDAFLELNITLPATQTEQQLVSNVFDSLNNIIALHQRKLELEQQKKKALMQLLLTGKVRCV